MGHRHYVLLRRCHNIPVRLREDVPLRRLGDVPLRSRWVFHLGRTCDVSGSYKKTSLRLATTSRCRVGPVHLFFALIKILDVIFK